MYSVKTLILTVTMFCLNLGLAIAGIKASASIKPLHSLVSGVMAGVAAPNLIVKGIGSPHGWSLRPSQIRSLARADLIFLMGYDLEKFLERPLQISAQNAIKIELYKTKGLNWLKIRQFDDFETDKHQIRINDKEEEKKSFAKFDLHIWLDPVNAKILVFKIADVLSTFDPKNSKVYNANSALIARRLDSLIKEVNSRLKYSKEKKFMVFHDAYQYFENRFGISMLGSISVSSEMPPGAKRIKIAKDKVKLLNSSCVFIEPQISPKLAQIIVEGTNSNVRALDPLGSELEPNKELYFTLIRNLSNSIQSCGTVDKR